MLDAFNCLSSEFKQNAKNAKKIANIIMLSRLTMFAILV